MKWLWDKIKNWIMPITLTVIITVKVICAKNIDYSKNPDEYLIDFKSLIAQPDEISCGPTCVTMLLKEYGSHVTLNEVRNSTATEWFKFSRKPIGLTLPEMMNLTLNKNGLSCTTISGNSLMLKHYVSKKKPVIILVRSGYSTWHYVIVVGYNKNQIIIANPSNGKMYPIKESDLISSWQFKSDMNGKEFENPCRICKGKGFSDHQTNFKVCPFCQGTGESPDVMLGLIRFSQIKEMTMIVPNKSLK